MLPKNKVDSKIRFQHRGFKSQLREARNYKRSSSPVTERGLAHTWNRAQLISIWAKIGIALLLPLAVYIVYVPNVMYIKRVEISGLDPKQADEVRILLSQYFTSSKFWPQSSFLALSTQKAGEYILQKDRDIFRIIEIQKKFPNSLSLSLEPRRPSYLITSSEGSYIASNDLFLTRLESATSSAAKGLINIKISGKSTIGTNAYYQNYSQLQAVSALEKLIPEILNDKADYYELLDEKEPGITARLKNGWSLLLESDSDLPQTMEQLRLLLASIDPQDSKRLAYIDMRIKNKSYVCLKGTPCATAPTIIPQIPDALTPTSTSASSTAN